MQDVIREIMKIDQLAFESQKYNLEALEKKKQDYMNELKAYKENKLSKAEKKASEVYKQILDQGEQAIKVEEERAKQIGLAVQYNYIQSEAQLVEQLFQELLQMEG